MKYIRCEQGSPEWHEARAGKITASMFAEVRKRAGGLTEQQQTYVDAILSGSDESAAMKLAGYKAKPKTDKITRAIDGERLGDFTDQAKRYAFRLAVERISGKLLAEEVFENYAMRRGHELEPDARRLHEQRKGILVDPVGFCRTDCGRFGSSLDGVIDSDGASEYKCYISPDSLYPILIDGECGYEMDQVQGGLWINERQYCDFVLYCPALEPIGRELTIITVQRDQEYIDKLEADLLEFDSYVESIKTKLIEG